MSRLKKIAEIPAGAGPSGWSWASGSWCSCWPSRCRSKLTGAEKNDAKYWLPGDAESTKVLDVQSRFQSPNVYTGSRGL